MRILHVNDAAGVAVTLAKYQARIGHEVSVVVRSKDRSGLHEQVTSVCSNRQGKNIFIRTLDVLRFYCYVAVHGRCFDIIHIHTQYLVCLFLPFKPKVIEFHGSDVRKWPSRRWAVDVAVTSLFLRLFQEGLVN
jgi:hypothetical protein